MHVALLEPPPPVRPALALAAALLILLPAGAGIVWALVDGDAPPTPLIVVLVLFIVPVATGLARLTRKKRVGALDVTETRIRVELPGAPLLDAALAELRVLRAAKVGLVVGTQERALVVPRASLAGGAATAADVVTAVLMRVRALPPSAALSAGGAPLADLLAQRDAAAAVIEKRPLVVTWGTGAVIALVFVLEIVAGAMLDRRILLELGAARRDLVLPGGLAAGVAVLLGLWRIPAAALLHGHLVHLALNAMSLLVLGPVLERWLLKWRYALVLLGSALAGTGASALLRDDVATVGLSGGLFGLLGALATTTLKYRRAPLVGPRLPLRSWVILLVANGVLTAAPGVDAWAHVAGALAGALIAWPLTPSIRAGERVPSVVKEPAARVLATVVLAIVAVGLVGIVRAFVVVMMR